MGDRLFTLALRQNRHPLTVSGVATHIVAQCLPSHPAPDESKILTGDSSVLELTHQAQLGSNGLCRNHQAGRVLIEPVNNTRPGDVRDGRKVGNQTIN